MADKDVHDDEEEVAKKRKVCLLTPIISKVLLLL